MISRNHDWIFVHIQKTGGTSIRTALGIDLNDEYKHFLATELRDEYGGDTWNRCFKFTFVRNPWDRLVSWWSMIQDQKDHPAQPNDFFRYVLQNAHTFEQFIDNCTDDVADADGRKSILRNQIDYLSDANGNLIIDFIGRFERLQADFDCVCRHLRVPQCPLVHANASRHAHYTQYYTPRLVTVVSDRFANDIAAFDYRFGE